MTIQLDLPPELEQFIADKVGRGEFATPGDAVCAIVSREREREQKLAELRRLVAEGVAEADRGEFADLDPMEIWDAVEKQLDAEQAAG